MGDSNIKKNEWVSPNVQKFGEKKGAAKIAKAMFAAECGESALRYGPECGIRTGNKCQPRNPAQCTPIQFGPSCLDRQGMPCKDAGINPDALDPTDQSL